MLQQEQDRRAIPDCKMLLLPWTGGRNNKSSSILCRRYAKLLITVLVMIWDQILIRVEMWDGVNLSHLSLCLWCLFHWSFGTRSFSWSKKIQCWDCCCITQRLHNLQINSLISSFAQLFVCFISDMFSGIDRRPGHLKLCQKWPQLQVNRSLSPLFTVISLTRLPYFDSSPFTLEMSGKAVSAL